MVCQATCPNCQAAKSDAPTPGFSVESMVQFSVAEDDVSIRVNIKSVGWWFFLSFLRRWESMVAVLVLRDKLRSFPAQAGIIKSIRTTVKALTGFIRS